MHVSIRSKLLIAFGVMSLLTAVVAAVAIQHLAQLASAAHQVARGLHPAPARILSQDEIGILTRHFNDMVARLDRSAEDQRRFFADVSHELRVPLTVIRGEAEVALRGMAKSPEQYHETLTTIVDVAGQMGRLVDDLLFLSRSDAGQIPYEREAVCLPTLLVDVINQHRGRAADMGVEIALDVHDHAMVVGDPGRLKQLFGILLDNAIRYTPGPGRIAIRLGASSEESEVVVADNGIGISKDDQPKVFERFYRGGRVAPESDSGAGLGLAIARAIAEAHHGRIILESARHEGTTVSVVLPQAPPPP